MGALAAAASVSSYDALSTVLTTHSQCPPASIPFPLLFQPEKLYASLPDANTFAKLLSRSVALVRLRYATDDTERATA